MNDQAKADALDAALSSDALHKAAKEGERAAQTLLIYGKAGSAGVSGLAAHIRMSIGFAPDDLPDGQKLRRLAAKAMSIAALDAPIRKIRQTARAFLKEEGLPKAPEFLLDIAHGHASLMLMQDEAHELPPTWLLANGVGQVKVVVTPYGDDAAEKDAVAAGIRQMMRDNGIIAYCHLGEAWMGPAESAVRPRDDPQRIEIVFAYAFTTSESANAIWAIKRDADGKPVDLELLQRGEGGTGRFCWLLSNVNQEA